MIVGIVGCGSVGGTLARWFKENTLHEVRLYDPPKGCNDSLIGCEAIFISIPVPDTDTGQDQFVLNECVRIAKEQTENVFIRSTVLPTTNDRLGTIALPEFLTERTAYQDMSRYPILCGKVNSELIDRIFPNKEIIMMSNIEAEMAKMAHNCFGALKVTYFNTIYSICKEHGANYENVRRGFSITGFIERQHTEIAPDGHYGYGGKCFPTNIRAIIGWLGGNKPDEQLLFRIINQLNEKFRFNK